MKVTITIDCNNAAFEDDLGGPEVARILRSSCYYFENMNPKLLADKRIVADINGNNVGHMVVSNGK